MTTPDTIVPGGGEQEATADGLQTQINGLVEELYRNEDKEGTFRKLCRLAYTCKIDPEDFRLMLLRAELRASRASEIKAVLLCPEVCGRFVRRDGRLSWKAALAEARGKIEDPVEMAAANLIRTLLRKASEWTAEECENGREDGWSLEDEGHYQFLIEHADGRTVRVRRLSLSAPDASPD